MSLIKAQGAGEVSTGFYSHTIDQSIKFNDDDAQYLSRTPASAGNRRTWTWSAWVKRGNSVDYAALFTAWSADSGDNYFVIRFDSDQLVVKNWSTVFRQTNRLFRDKSAWLHIVVAVDTTDGTADNRIKVYVNGVQETSFATNNAISQNTDTSVNNTNIHVIGTNYFGSSYQYAFDGYIAEVNMIDGTALTPASFGETKNNIWTPKNTSGLTFGTNGFHLTFKDDVVSEGFNAVTWRGTGADNSISGLGFSPAFVWIKDRTDAAAHYLFDVNRGALKDLYSNLSIAEYSASQTLKSFDADGFTVGNNTGVNGSADDMLAWCWEGGGTPTATNSAGAGATPTAGSVKIDGSNLGSALAGTIPATKISANTARGFSIVEFEGTQTAGSVAHGLSSAPKFIIAKNRDSATEWPVYHDSANSGGGSYLRLNSTAVNTSSSIIWTDSPSSTVVNIGTYEYINRDTMIMYCFAEVSGYSAFGTYSGSGSAGKQVTGLGFKPAWLMIKSTTVSGSNWAIWDNTRSVVDPRDDALVANGTDVEFANNSSFSVDFLSDGFELNSNYGDINQSSATYIYMAFADTREAAFFKDVSSNGNHFTPVNLDYRDSVPDVPTNNFATMNALANRSGTLSNGNLSLATTTTQKATDGTFQLPSSLKWYFEFAGNSVSGAYGEVGISTAGTELWSNGAGFYSQYIRFNNATIKSGLSFGTTDVLQVAYDGSNRKVWLGVNDTWYAADGGTDGDPSAGTNESGTLAANEWFPSMWTVSNSGVLTANFGQDSSFDGIRSTANSNADSNGKGSFAFAPPTGFLALCSQNLPDVDIIDGTEHFNTVLFSATAGSGASITGYGFAPDWVWTKARNTTQSHQLFDSVRGDNKIIYSNLINAESAQSAGYFTLESDGFDYGTSTFSSNTYVGWGWKAGGTAASNTDGSITSSVSAGEYMSICTWTGDGNSGATIGHGLGKVPSMILVKRRNTDLGWTVYHEALGTGSEMYLNMTQAVTNSNFWLTSPTTSVFSVSSSDYINKSGDTYVGYVFANLEGACKVGSYVGNGNADGPFVYTGHRVSWIMIKDTTSTNGWQLHDNKRPGYNPAEQTVDANTTAAESNSNDLDILSNGFKVRNTYGTANASGSTYIYLAFAEQPFKFANAQ